MVDFTMTVEGLNDLEKALHGLNVEYGPKSAGKAMRTAIRKALKGAEGDIMANTPVDTGGLKSGVKTRLGKPTKKMLKSEHYHSNQVMVGRVGWVWKGSPSLWNRALAIEFGTQEQAARPVLWPAMNSNQSQMIATFKDELGASIEKTAKSLHRKRMKG